MRAADERWAARARAAGVPDVGPVALADSDNGADRCDGGGRGGGPQRVVPREQFERLSRRVFALLPGLARHGRAAVAANGKAFTLARQARQHQRFDWGLTVQLFASNGLSSRLNAVRTLANTLGDGAEYAHEMGDDVAALEAIRDIRHISMGVRDEPMLVSDLVGIGTEAVALSRLNEITPGLRIAPEDDAAARAGNADAVRAAANPTTRRASPPRRLTPANVAVHRGVAGRRGAQARMARACSGERAFLQDMAADPHNTRWLIRPMWRLDAPRVDEPMGAAMEAAAQPTWPAALDSLRAARARLPGTPAPPMSVFWPTAVRRGPAKRQPIDFTRLLSQDAGAGLTTGRAIDQNWRVATERRLAAVGLAVRLYQAEHDRWPVSIDELVPKYLPRGRPDPMAADGSGLRYLLVRGGLPGGGDRPIAYRAGTDGVFGTTPLAQMPKEPLYSWVSGAGTMAQPGPVAAAVADVGSFNAGCRSLAAGSRRPTGRSPRPAPHSTHWTGISSPAKTSRPTDEPAVRLSSVIVECRTCRPPKTRHHARDLHHAHDGPRGVGLVVEARLLHRPGAMNATAGTETSAAAQP